MSLKQKLAAIADPAAHDKTLSDAFKTLIGTEGYEALQILLTAISESAEGIAFSPNVTADQRAFAAGSAQVVRMITKNIDSAVTFDPATAKYEPAGPESDTDPDDDKLVEAEFNDTPY